HVSLPLSALFHFCLSSILLLTFLPFPYTTLFRSPDSRRRASARRFYGAMVASGSFADSSPPSRTPSRVHKDAAARQPPEITETARDFVTDARDVPTPPAIARYSDAFISLPGLPFFRCFTCSGSMFSSITRTIA